MWKAVSRSYPLCEKTRVSVYMYPRVKCRDAAVKGGEGRVRVRGSPSAWCLFEGQLRSWVWKYGDQEMSMNWCDENIAVARL